MKNIIVAFAIVLAAIGACNPPQSTTGSSSDSTATNNNNNSNNNTRDTSGSMQRDTSMRQ